MGLTNYERETIINTNEADDFYSVYTFNSKLKRMMNEFAEQYPDLCQRTDKSEYGDETFWIKKKNFTVRPKKPISEERRQKLSEQAKARGFGAKSDG